jgi:hypothetical protein
MILDFILVHDGVDDVDEGARHVLHGKFAKFKELLRQNGAERSHSFRVCISSACNQMKSKMLSRERQKGGTVSLRSIQKPITSFADGEDRIATLLTRLLQIPDRF